MNIVAFFCMLHLLCVHFLLQIGKYRTFFQTLLIVFPTLKFLGPLINNVPTRQQSEFLVRIVQKCIFRLFIFDSNELVFVCVFCTWHALVRQVSLICRKAVVQSLINNHLSRTSRKLTVIPLRTNLRQSSFSSRIGFELLKSI